METAVTEKKTERKEVKRHHFDFPFFIVLMLITAFGLVMLFSASYYYAQQKYSDGTYFLKRQLVFFAVGLVMCVISSGLTRSTIIRSKEPNWDCPSSSA